MDQCTMCSLYSFFSIRPNEVRHVVKFHEYIAIKHIFIPARSVEWKIEKIGFSWFSNSKLVIFPQIFPCSCYRAIKYSPVVTTGFLHFMPRSLCKYKGIWLYPCINYRAIRYCPVVATGHFLLQGYMTVQRAHCAVHYSAVQCIEVQTLESFTPDGSNMTHDDPGWLCMARDDIPGQGDSRGSRGAPGGTRGV